MEEDFTLAGDSAEGKITSVGKIDEMETKFGSRKYAPVTVELEGGQEITLRLWLPPKGSSIRPNSNTGRLLKRLKVEKLSDIVGKKVPLRLDGRGFHRFDA